jgi:hypothetical protein
MTSQVALTETLCPAIGSWANAFAVVRNINKNVGSLDICHTTEIAKGDSIASARPL